VRAELEGREKPNGAYDVLLADSCRTVRRVSQHVSPRASLAAHGVDGTRTRDLLRDRTRAPADDDRRSRNIAVGCHAQVTIADVGGRLSRNRLQVLAGPQHRRHRDCPTEDRVYGALAASTSAPKARRQGQHQRRDSEAVVSRGAACLRVGQQGVEADRGGYPNGQREPHINALRFASFAESGGLPGDDARSG
jgi:hypothetical protein